MPYNITKTTRTVVVTGGQRTVPANNAPAKTLRLPNIFKVSIGGIPDCYGGVNGIWSFNYSETAGVWLPYRANFPNASNSTVTGYLCDTIVPQTALDPNSFNFFSRVQAGTCLTSYGVVCSLYVLLRFKRITIECEFNAPIKLIPIDNTWILSGPATVKNQWSWLPGDPLYPTYGRNVIALGYSPDLISASQISPCSPVNYSIPYPCTVSWGGTCLRGDCPDTSYKEALNLVRLQNGQLIPIPITVTISGSSALPPTSQSPITTISNTSDSTLLDDTSIAVLAGGSLGSGKPITLGNNSSDAAQKVLEKFFENHKLQKNMTEGLDKKFTPGLLGKILEMFKAAGFGTIMVMPIIPKIPVLGGGETASTGIITVIAFSGDNMTYEILNLEIPLDSSELYS
jgi:hypothetical protein